MHNIDQEHPDYTARRAMWQRYRDMYVGGEQIKNNASEYLARRQMEPADVYSERLEKVFYENYIGSIIDWYAATLFRREPVLHVEGNNPAGRKFFNEFAADCDLKGSTITSFFRKQLVNTLVYGTSYALLDFPRVEKAVGSRAEEEASGAARAYLVEFTPENLINWSMDDRGNYEWVVLRTSHLRNADPESSAWAPQTRWTYYDRGIYREYRETGSGDNRHVTLASEGPHALASQGRVPLFEMRASEGLWLMNKAGLLQLEHFNKSNALSWALTIGLFATPVVYSERPWNQIVSESYYIQLGPNDRFGWTEPEGKVYQIAADNLTRLQEEIYRVCYLLTQGGQTGAGVQSGLSKLRDFAITQEVLRGYGDLVKDTLNRVLRAVEVAREDGLQIDASGLDEFDVGDFTSDLEDARSLLSLGIQSATLKKQIFKRLAAKYLCDVRQETKDRISQEIEDSFGATQ